MDLRDVVDDLRKRIYDLERNQTRGSDTITVVGTALGVEPPTTGATTNPCRPRTSATLHEATIELDSAATADVTFDFLKSGASIGSVTCPTGESDVTGTIEVGFSRGDQHKVQATDPGTGYQSFTIHEVWHTTRDWWHPPVMMFAGASTLPQFELDTSDESGTFGSVRVDMDISAGSHTVTVTFTAVGGGFTLGTIHWENDPDGAATPFASAFPGTPGPADAASTDVWPGGTMTILIRAVSPDATIGDFVSYEINVS